jgi:RNA polymerase sigma-70 factor (ECF subfamily)
MKDPYISINEVFIKDPVKMANEYNLVEQAKKNRHAFGELFDRYYDDIYTYILHRTANIELAQDLTSDTFIKVMRKLWTFRWRKIPFSAWLFKIASNEVNGYYRKHKNVKKVPLGDLIDNIDKTGENFLIREELKEAEKKLEENIMFLELHKAIASLKNKYQEIITLRFFENKKIKEIAEISGKSEGTVKSLVHRAVKQLHSKLSSSNLNGSIDL